MHQEFRGTVVHRGINNSMNDFFSFALASSNQSILYLILFSFYGALMLSLLEKFIIKIFIKYNINSNIFPVIIIALGINFIVNTGTPFMLYISTSIYPIINLIQIHRLK